MDTDRTAISRRQLGTLSMAAIAGMSNTSHAQEGDSGPRVGEESHEAMMARLPRLKFGLLMFSGMTALDLIAPQLIMSTMMATEVHLVSATTAPVVSDSAVAILPTGTYADCPGDLDVFFVPGGPRGTRSAIDDDDLLDFVADRGGRARYVTSVCTGSVILGAAGLLKGYRATSHWATRSMLAQFGADPADERVVIDRNRVTGGGITAGLDFGLMLSKILRGEHTARLQELILEYDPLPPFAGGTPRTAQPETLAMARDVLTPDLNAIAKAANDARRRRFG